MNPLLLNSSLLLLLRFLLILFILFTFFRALVGGFFLAFSKKRLSLFLSLSLELSHDFIPVLHAYLVGARQLPAHVDIVRFFFLSFIVFAIGRVQDKLFVRKFQMWTFKVHTTAFWLTIGDCNIKTICLEDSLDLSCHFRYIEIGIISTE